MNKILLKNLMILVAISLVCSSISSYTTYYCLKKNYPRFAIVDLHYLQTEFIQNLSRYLVDHQEDISDVHLERIISSEQKMLEELLKEVSEKENLILFQKQTLAIGDVQDVTSAVEKRLFQVISKQIKNEVKNEKN